MNKKKIAFLFDVKNLWIRKYINTNTIVNYKNKYAFYFFFDYKKVKNFDVVFVLGYTRILKKIFLKKNKLSLVVHESNLPKGRGSAPIQWQLLDKKKKITFCLIIINQKVDQGDIILKDYVVFKGHELNDEIRMIQAKKTVKIINKFLKSFPKFVKTKQKGKSTFYRRRNVSDSELDINKSLKEQFNLLRVCDNNRYPSFFFYKKNKYILKIYKA